MKKVDEAPRVPRKKGQPAGSKKHSDLYTDENPKGTIKGLKFATVKDARASVSKIRNSGRSHAHKIQAAVAMEQRAREMGKSSQAAVYRAYINKMKKKTKKKNEDTIPSPSRKGVERMKRKGNTSVPYGSGYKKVNENDYEVKLKPELSEYIGHEQIVTFNYSDQELLAKFASTIKIEMNTETNLFFDLNQISLFYKNTERRV